MLPPIKGLIESSLLEWRGRVAAAAYLPGCNFRCPFCHNHGLVLSPSEYDTMPVERMFARLDELRKWLDGVVVSGGEPTLHPGLPTLVAKLGAAGWPVKLDTNGSRPEVLAGLLELNLIEAVSMDIKAPLEPLAYRRNAGVTTDLNAIRTSIDLLAASDDLEVEFRTTVTPGLLDEQEVQAIREFVAERAPRARYKIQEFNPADPLDAEACRGEGQHVTAPETPAADPFSATGAA